MGTRFYHVQMPPDGNFFKDAVEPPDRITEAVKLVNKDWRHKKWYENPEETSEEREYFERYGRRIKPENMDPDGAMALAAAIVKHTVGDVIDYEIACLLGGHSITGARIKDEGMRTLRRCAERASQQLKSQYYDVLTLGMGGDAVLREAPRVAREIVEQRYAPARLKVAELIKESGIPADRLMEDLDLTRDELAHWLMYPFPKRIKYIKGAIKGFKEVKDGERIQGAGDALL